MRRVTVPRAPTPSAAGPAPGAAGQRNAPSCPVAFRAVDRCAASCTGEVTVTVPHDRSPKKTPDDGGPLYDSTLGAAPCDGDSCDPADSAAAHHEGPACA